MIVGSSIVILCLAPVEDKNKSLDAEEQKVYRKRTYLIWAMGSRVGSCNYLLLLTADISFGLSNYDILGYGCYACSWKDEEYFIVGL